MSNIPDYSKEYTMEDIGRRITELREKKGCSIYQLQLSTDVNRTVIKESEIGKNKLRIDTLLKIINGLGVSPAEFFSNLH